MPQVTTDTYGHELPLPSNTMTAGAVSTTAINTIAPTAAAGATPTVTAVNANDRAGTFTLNPVTGGGAQAAGAVVQVTFAQPYADIPKSVIVNMCNNAAGAAGVGVACSAQSVTASGFTVNVAAVLTTANNYNVFYQVAAT